MKITIAERDTFIKILVGNIKNSIEELQNMDYEVNVLLKETLHNIPLIVSSEINKCLVSLLNKLDTKAISYIEDFSVEDKNKFYAMEIREKLENETYSPKQLNLPRPISQGSKKITGLSLGALTGYVTCFALNNISPVAVLASTILSAAVGSIAFEKIKTRNELKTIFSRCINYLETEKLAIERWIDSIIDQYNTEFDKFLASINNN